MQLDRLEKILDNSTVTTLEDQSGYPVHAIGFTSMQDAQDAYKLLREIYAVWVKFPELFGE